MGKGDRLMELSEQLYQILMFTVFVLIVLALINSTEMPLSTHSNLNYKVFFSKFCVSVSVCVLVIFRTANHGTP
jgi:hypothetical protein